MSNERSIFGYSILALATFATAGCGLDVGEAVNGEATAEPDEAVTATKQALPTLPWADEYVWNQGSARVDMGDFASRICVLSGVAGRFDGLGEKVRVVLGWQTFLSRWFLEGSSQQNGVSARAVCFDRNQFTSSRGSDRIVSNEFVDERWANQNCINRFINTTNGSHASYLVAMGGAFFGGGEYIQLGQNFTPSLFNELYTGSCQSGGISAKSRGFFVGSSAAPTIPKLVAPPGQTAQNAEFVVASGGAGQIITKVLPPVADSMCFLTRVSGSFRGGGERITLTKSTNGLSWTLSAQRGSASSGINASARCMKRAQ